MQVEFNSENMKLQTPFTYFPAFEIDVETAEDIKTYLMSDMTYIYVFNDVTYRFQIMNNTHVKLTLVIDDFVAIFMVTLDSLFKAIDDIAEHCGIEAAIEAEEQNDPDYEDDYDVYDDIHEEEYDEFSEDEE